MPSNHTHPRQPPHHPSNAHGHDSTFGWTQFGAWECLGNAWEILWCGLGFAGMSEGRELVDRILDEMAVLGLEPDAKESELLSIAEALANRAEQLEERIAEDGLSITLNSGRVVVNPLVAEARMTRTSLATVLTKISMTEAPAKDPAKQASAQARWRAHNIAKGRMTGG
jgi:hypothetical protein